MSPCCLQLSTRLCALLTQKTSAVPLGPGVGGLWPGAPVGKESGRINPSIFRAEEADDGHLTGATFPLTFFLCNARALGSFRLCSPFSCCLPRRFHGQLFHWDAAQLIQGTRPRAGLVIPVRRSKRSHQGRLPYSLSLGEFGADHTPSMTASAHLLRRSACRSAYIPGMHGEAVAPPTPPPPLEICPTVATTPRSSPPTFNVSPSRITTRASTLTPSDSTTVRSRRTWSLTSISPGKSGSMSRPTVPTRPKTTIVHLISARIPILQVRI